MLPSNPGSRLQAVARSTWLKVSTTALIALVSFPQNLFAQDCNPLGDRDYWDGMLCPGGETFSGLCQVIQVFKGPVAALGVAVAFFYAFRAARGDSSYWKHFIVYILVAAAIVALPQWMELFGLSQYIVGWDQCF